MSQIRHLSAEIWPVEDKGVRIDMVDHSCYTVVGQRLFGQDIMQACGMQSRGAEFKFTCGHLFNLFKLLKILS